MKSLRIIIHFLLLFNLTQLQAEATVVKKILGYREYATLLPERITLKAKLDTGALTASLNAIHIEEFTKDNEIWVRFDLPIDNDRVLPIEKPLVRQVKVKGRLDESNTATTTSRPVIHITICIGNTVQTIEVSLTNRENFLNPLLLGRYAIEALNAIIDPNETFTQPKVCN